MDYSITRGGRCIPGFQPYVSAKINIRISENDKDNQTGNQQTGSPVGADRRKNLRPGHGQRQKHQVDGGHNVVGAKTQGEIIEKKHAKGSPLKKHGTTHSMAWVVCENSKQRALTMEFTTINQE